MSSDDEDQDQDLAEIGREAIEALQDRPLPHRDPEVLKSYLDDGYTYKEIGDEFDVHPKTVGEWVREHGLNGYR